MKIMFSAGEASGDMHAAAVAEMIKQKHPHIEMLGMGGNAMRRAGVRIVYDIEHLGIIGVVEIIKHLPFFFKLRKHLRDIIEKEKPDVFVCVDYPGFNMKLAHMVKQMGIPVVYYIAPTIWAWNKGRAKNIVRDVNTVASIFPFEAKEYEAAGAKVTFVGHPLIDTVHTSMSYEEACIYFNVNKEAKRILLMPGSRKNEVMNLLPVMLQACNLLIKNVNCQIFIPRAETISKSMLEEIIQKNGNLPVTITERNQYDLMSICTACVASSGTATLETALMELPTVLVYKLSPITWFLAKHLVHIKYAGLPNIILNKEVTPELLQSAITPKNIKEIIEPWITDSSIRNKNVIELRRVREKLGNSGAVQRVVELILNVAEKRNV